MPISLPLTRLLGLQPISPGQPAPPLSLTAEDGTWIRLADLKERRLAVLVFSPSLQRDDAVACLEEISSRIAAFEELDAVVFGIAQHRPDALRALRARHGLAFHLLYDPLALLARSYGASRHLLPRARPTVVVVDRGGTVLASHRGRIPVEELLALLAAHEGRPVPEAAPLRAVSPVRGAGDARGAVRDLDAAAAAALLADEGACWLLLDVRPAEAFAAWHPEGAVHVPLDELPHRYQELGQNTDVICLSDTGGQSAAAAEFLASVGFSDVVNVLDGTSGWPGAPEEVS